MKKAKFFTSSAKLIHERINAILSVVIIVSTFLIFDALLFKRVPPENKDVVLFILGVLSSIVSQVISYYFGSSKGSDDKTKVLSKTIDQQQQANQDRNDNGQTT